MILRFTSQIRADELSSQHRWVRTVREECLDHILIINAEHLQRVLIEFAQYQRRKVLGGIINDCFRSSDRYLLSTL